MLFELLNAMLTQADDFKSLPHQRCEFGVKHVGQHEPHGLIMPTDQPFCPGLLRSYLQARIRAIWDDADTNEEYFL